MIAERRIELAEMVMKGGIRQVESREDRDATRPAPLRFVIFILPLTAAFGSLLPGFGPVFGFRVLSLAVILYALTRPPAPGLRLAVVQCFLLMAALWVGIGLFSLVFSSDLAASLRRLSPVLFGLPLALALVALPARQKIYRYLFYGWSLSFLGTSIVAILEMLFGRANLPGFLRNSREYNSDVLIASVFSDPNGYAAYLVTVFPFLVAGGIFAPTRKWRISFGALTIVSIVLLLATGSRLGLSAVVVESVVLVAIAGARFRTTLGAGLLGAGLIVSIVGAGFAEPIVDKLPLTKLAEATPARMAEEALGGGGASGSERLNVTLNGLWMLVQSGGFGVGAGNFEQIVATGRVPYPTYGTLNPHNGWIELLSEYGLFVFVAFILWVWVAGSRCTRYVRSREASARYVALPVLVALIGNALGALADGTYFTSNVTWMFLATVLVAATLLEERARAETARYPRGTS